MLCADVSEHSVSPIFIGGVNKENNRDEIVRVPIVRVPIKPQDTKLLSA
jgi:hypothetical protein